MKIMPAIPTDHFALTEITKRSKAFWGYHPEQLKAWSDDLTITSEYICKNIVIKLLLENEIVAYYSLFQPENKTIKLDNLFVLPEFIGKGLGKIMLEHALQKAQNLACTSMVLDADPNAEGFYSKFGFVVFGKKATSIPGRYLPMMRREWVGEN